MRIFVPLYTQGLRCKGRSSVWSFHNRQFIVSSWQDLTVTYDYSSSSSSFCYCLFMERNFSFLKIIICKRWWESIKSSALVIFIQNGCVLEEVTWCPAAPTRPPTRILPTSPFSPPRSTHPPTSILLFVSLDPSI